MFYVICRFFSMQVYAIYSNYQMQLVSLFLSFHDERSISSPTFRLNMTIWSFAEWFIDQGQINLSSINTNAIQLLRILRVKVYPCMIDTFMHNPTQIVDVCRFVCGVGRTLFLYLIHSKIHHGSTGDCIVFIVVLRSDLLLVAPHRFSNLEIQVQQSIQNFSCHQEGPFQFTRFETSANEHWMTLYPKFGRICLTYCASRICLPKNRNICLENKHFLITFDV